MSKKSTKDLKSQMSRWLNRSMNFMRTRKSMMITAFLLLLIFSCMNPKTQILKSSSNILNGRWKVIESSFAPFEHVSYCDKLEIGSIFSFGTDGSLKVYNNGNTENCNGEQFYELDSNFIQIQEWDMLFNYELEKLVSDTMIFRIRRIPSHIYETENINTILSSSIYQGLITDGIKVTLVKTVI